MKYLGLMLKNICFNLEFQFNWTSFILYDNLNLGMSYPTSADRFQLEYLNEAPEMCVVLRRHRDGSSGALQQVAGHLGS